MNEKDERTESHKSFGQVSFSRISGSTGRLYGTSITHENTIILEISESQFTRHLNQYWYHPKDKLIEVQMSQSQFAELITSMNMGAGVPCTIRFIKGKGLIEKPKSYDNVRDEFKKEFQQEINRITENSQIALKTAKNILSQKTIKKSELSELVTVLNSIEQDLKENLRFVASQFDRQTDKSVNEAKAEVESFVENKIRSIGIDGLKMKTQSLLENNKENSQIESKE